MFRWSADIGEGPSQGPFSLASRRELTMPNRKPVQFDRSHIDVRDAIQMRYWSKHFGVSREQLESAVQKVGNAADTVRKELTARNLVEPPQPLTCFGQ